MDLEERRQLLLAAGLEVVADAWTASDVAPMDAWRPVITGLIEPDVRVRIEESGDHLTEVDRQWERLADGAGVFGPDGECLISVAGGGAGVAPWARVRRSSAMSPARVLGAVPGEPEFVALSVDGRVVCGATTEECEVWLITALLR